MPKLSVYVQDELWEQVKHDGIREGEKPNNSQLVQRALEAMLESRAARTAAASEGAVLDRERFERVLNQVREGARLDFERGYVAALELVELIGYDGLNFIVAHNSADIYDALEHDLFPKGPKLSSWRDEHELKFHPGVAGFTVYREGANRAIRDLWNELRAERMATDPDAIDELDLEVDGEGS